jgi:putative SOS response-associated peptidase YedK
VSGGRVFAFAGLWDVWGERPPRLATCCTLTTVPNDLVATVHDRMPVILTAEHFADWLSPDAQDRRLRELMTAFPAERMSVAEATPAVN